jgi:hypothetical protein
MNLRIQITIKDNNGRSMDVHPVDVNVEMPEDGPMIIDDVEREILRLDDVIGATISAYLEELSKEARTTGEPDQDRRIDGKPLA